MPSPHPTLIQGGMGIAVSGWPLARAVSRRGQLGVVSGVGLGLVLARRLERGDPDGSTRRALARFPMQDMVARAMSRHFVPGGRAAGTPYRSLPMPTVQPSPLLLELLVLGCFVEVWLAKEGHSGVVGMNLLEKIQFPTLACLFGAMLAGVDYVLMGAGIPRAIPGVLDRLSRGEVAHLKIDVEETTPGADVVSTFDPAAFCGGTAPTLSRPQFLAIVASATLATTLARKASGRVDGFVIEGETAGGHNAPPRGPLQLTSRGEPLYGPRDVVDLERFRELDRPFWLAGSFGRPGRLAEALRLGAAGIQVGTAFAFCEESGIDSAIKRRTIQRSREGTARTFTDPLASPTGFPFKVVNAADSLADETVYRARPRICDIGYLRTAYRRGDGSLGYRCPAEPVADFVRKGGTEEATVGRQCVCNGLLSTVGMGQVRPGTGVEPVLLTAGNDVADVAQWAAPGRDAYTADEVVDRLLAEVPSGQGGPVPSSACAPA